MAGASAWREERREERREEHQQEAPHGQSPHSSPTPTGHSTPTAGAQPPDGWTQEEWDHVPASMRGDIASGKGYMSKDAVQRYINEK